MMIRPILTICAAMTAVAAATSLAQAQQSYPVQQQGYPAPGQAYSPYPPSGPSDYRRGPNPNFDSLQDDDDDPDARVSNALPTPGPVMSPDDPRYGRPMGAPPAYPSERVAAPSGPVMSPDDPRYGRPMGAPPVYSDRGAPNGPVMSPDDPRYGRPMGAAPVYSGRGAPTGPVMSPDDPRYGRPMAPPAVIYSDRDGGRPPANDGLQPPVSADGKPMTVAA